MTSYRLGINTCFAVKRWPRPEEWARIAADELGLDLVQHSLDLVDLDAGEAAVAAQAADVRGACGAAGLELSSTFTGLIAYSTSLLLHPDPAARRRAVDWYERVIAFSALAGARRAGGHVGSLSTADHGDPVRREALWEELADTLHALATTARAAGLDALLVENMASAREPSTIGEIERLLSTGGRAHVPIELCLDVGHHCVPGTSGDERDPYAWLRRLGTRAPVVHLQQSDAEGDHHWPFTPEYNARGRIEAARVLDAIEASGAAEVELILEVIPPFEQDDRALLTDLRASVAHWRDALRSIGSDA
ncbi:sugar phosphate isomerase/epimerase family protein [Candidatus Solirubrobacter pratensis]|uniref:sugar phosphate isomerase/epimerase family protein n=1 Tax=Candidatus Solirubrobacter pratensis TaxID=1298857 RepID=UPI000419212D|nr:TIM barrel protein [Candidatus Solirubrobacter pratensis]